MIENPETFDELMVRILSVFPDAVVDEFNGELVIYPQLREVADGKLESTTDYGE